MSLELPAAAEPAETEAPPVPLIHGTFAFFKDKRGDLVLVLNSELTGAVSRKVPRMVVRQFLSKFPEAAALFGQE